MSRAFDTIDRGRLMNILRDEVCLHEDELRMCQMLLADTNLKVKLKEAVSEPFETTIGTPQGDGLPSILFAVYLERTVRDIWEALPPRPLCHSVLPMQNWIVLR